MTMKSCNEKLKLATARHTQKIEKNTNKKYSRPWQVLPFFMAFSASGSQTNTIQYKSHPTAAV